jgi:circadian clock protein KaiC
MLGLHFLAAGARVGEQSLYFGLYETPARLIAAADRVGLDLSSAVATGHVRVEWCSPVEGLLDVQLAHLLDAVRRQGVRRLFFDGIDAFRHVMYPDRLGPVMMALANELRALNVTTFMSAELRQLFGPQVDFPMPIASPITENILFLRSVELGSSVQRFLSILKVRDGGYDATIREFSISSSGMTIGLPAQNVDATLTGTARGVSGGTGTSRETTNQEAGRSEHREGSAG